MRITMVVDHAGTAVVCERCGARLVTARDDADEGPRLARFRAEHGECVADAYPAGSDE